MNTNTIHWADTTRRAEAARADRAANPIDPDLFATLLLLNPDNAR